ncbi:MAG: Gfo/Idh/MocA family oxidoreductase [Candidatus Hydrogenedentes bacterium]|nr:Gfo/Idh/MocA family oxidoreductase [Candidatus Hydrogenedentota bacterium]
MLHPRRHSQNRRQFLKTTAGAATAGLISAGTRAETGNEPLRLGIIGCGQRGVWLGHLFQEHTATRVVALADYFQDRLDEGAERLEVPADQCFHGLEGYRKLLDCELDAAAIISPPCFHPEQTVAALEAGKHVYLAKPIAADVAGCRDIARAAAAVKGKLSILVDFQTRNNPSYRQAAAHVRDGAIGVPVCGQAYYHTSRLNPKGAPEGAAGRLRNWVFDKALSGDIIVEQNIHVIDVANWMMGARPVAATGAGGRRVRTDIGDCWDHFIVTYRYPDGGLIDFSSSQFATGYNDLCTRIYGSEGTLDTHYGGSVELESRSTRWIGEKTSQIYLEGAVNNILDFHKSIAENQPLYILDDAIDSTLTSILGRIAAYEGRTITWDEMIEANERLPLHLDLPEDGPWRPAFPDRANA